MHYNSTMKFIIILLFSLNLYAQPLDAKLSEEYRKAYKIEKVLKKVIRTGKHIYKNSNQLSIKQREKLKKYIIYRHKQYKFIRNKRKSLEDKLVIFK